MKQLPQKPRPTTSPAPRKSSSTHPQPKSGAGGKPTRVPLASANPRPTRRPGPDVAAENEMPKLGMTIQQKLLIGMALAVVAALVVLLAVQPQNRADQRDQNDAIGTALAATGFTPPPTLLPGSDFGVDLVIYGIKNYIPVIPGEKVTFFINNKRDKSLYVSNCDGTILQRFLGTDVTDKAQTSVLTNWENVAPGGYPSCGPVGPQPVQIPPKANADASFPFDTSKTRPYNGEDWNIPGSYRLFLTYYLLCPAGGSSIDDCSDRHYSQSDTFQIVAPQYNTPQASTTPASPVASPTPNP